MSMTMAEVSNDPPARARKFQSQILQRLAGSQAQVAAALSVDESTISRMKEGLERYCLMLAHLNLKTVDERKVCIDRGEITYLRTTYAKVQRLCPWVLDEDESA